MPSKEELLRAALFVPCTSKEHLHNWIKMYLGLDMPDTIVCADDLKNPPSNSSPMDLIWLIYSQLMSKGNAEYMQVLGYSARGGYKCVKRGTLLKNKVGVVPIEDIKIGDEIWSGFGWRKVTNWIHDGIKQSKTIKLLHRGTLTVSPIHKVWSLTEDGPKWIESSNLKVGDLVAYDVNFPIQYDLNQEEFDDAYILGALAGDGCLAFIDRGHVTLTTADSFVLKCWQDFCMKRVQRLPKQSKSRKYDWRINSVKLCNWLLSKGCKVSHSFDKKIPDSIKTYSQISGFISGLFDTDGSVSSGRNRIVLSITSYSLAEGCRQLLTSLGIDSTLRSDCKLRKGQKHLVHTLTVGALDVFKLKDINIKIKAYKAGVLQFNNKINNPELSIPKKYCKMFLDNLPVTGGKIKRNIKKPSSLRSYHRISIDKIAKIVEYRKSLNINSWQENLDKIKQFRWIPIESISDSTADFYDLTVEQDHSYWSDGLISHNTLSAAVLEVLSILHADSNVAHMAALEAQAINCQEYVDKFLRRPILNEFLTSKNKRTVEVTKYVDSEGHVIPPIQYEKLGDDVKINYEQKVNTIKIVIATIAAANGLHARFTVFDEVDITPSAVLQEAKGIPEADRGRLPITFYTSTRKYAFGEVQKLIDNGEKVKLKVFHWNLIDMSQPCPSERHLPEFQQIPIYYSESRLRAISHDDWLLLSDKEKETYDRGLGYIGCLKNCTLFSSCKGRLALTQLSKSPLLKPIEQVQDSINRSTTEFARAQYLCWRPSSEGLIYPNFNLETHLITASQMMTKITGEVYPEHLSKSQLLNLLQELKAEFVSGMDHGYTHDFAVVTGALIGHILYIIDVISVRNYELQQRIDLCKDRIKIFNPVIYPDNAYPADNVTFRRNGFKLVAFEKDVLKGIENARVRIMPGGKLPISLYLLRNDESCERLARDMVRYHWRVDAHGELIEEPDTEDNDRLDALRYLCQNVPITKSGFIGAFSSDKPKQVYDKNRLYGDWMKNKVRELTGDTAVEDSEDIKWIT